MVISEDNFSPKDKIGVARNCHQSEPITNSLYNVDDSKRGSRLVKCVRPMQHRAMQEPTPSWYRPRPLIKVELAVGMTGALYLW